MTQEQLQQLTEGLTGEVIESEPVCGMTRPLKVRYEVDEMIIIKTIVYMYPADSAAWAAIREELYAVQ